uniref:Dynein, light chain, roadblock-type 1 n=1 Tax=Cyprinodon variegatus TaxID=28743 RepID=A0A3Q2FY80_CYPVA
MLLLLYLFKKEGFAEVEETLKRIQGQKGVQGIIIVNSEGIPIKSTMDDQSTLQYSALTHQLVMKARVTCSVHTSWPLSTEPESKEKQSLLSFLEKR